MCLKLLIYNSINAFYSEECLTSVFDRPHTNIIHAHISTSEVLKTKNVLFVTNFVYTSDSEKIYIEMKLKSYSTAKMKKIHTRQIDVAFYTMYFNDLEKLRYC